MLEESCTHQTTHKTEVTGYTQVREMVRVRIFFLKVYFTLHIDLHHSVTINIPTKNLAAGEEQTCTSYALTPSHLQPACEAPASLGFLLSLPAVRFPAARKQHPRVPYFPPGGNGQQLAKDFILKTDKAIRMEINL